MFSDERKYPRVLCPSCNLSTGHWSWPHPLAALPELIETFPVVVDAVSFSFFCVFYPTPSRTRVGGCRSRKTSETILYPLSLKQAWTCPSCQLYPTAQEMVRVVKSSDMEFWSGATCAWLCLQEFVSEKYNMSYCAIWYYTAMAGCGSCPLYIHLDDRTTHTTTA